MGERRTDRAEGVVIASTGASSAEDAAKEIAASITCQLAASGDKPEEALAGLVCFVCASYDTARFAGAIAAALPGAPIYGCTTAGELTPDGWASHSVVAIGFLRKNFTLVAHMLENLSHFGVEEGRASISEARAALMSIGPDVEPEHCFGLLLIDGMCRREEAVISALYSALDDIAVVGGSAGDGMSFEKTWIIRDGEPFPRRRPVDAVSHRPALRGRSRAIISSRRRLKMVVTDADTELRVVSELNAEPAATEYAHQVGLVESSLDAFSFASHPVLVRRRRPVLCPSIQTRERRRLAELFLRHRRGPGADRRQVARPLSSAAQRLFERMEAELGELSLYIGFDCILRRLDAEQPANRPTTCPSFTGSHRVFGFNTYGEQFRSMHVNQTFTGIALGYKRAKSLDEAPGK